MLRKIDYFQHTYLAPITRALLVVAGAILTLMMLLTVVDVIGRYIFNVPIDGAFELVEFMMAIFVPFALVYCEQKNSHIVVDLLYEKLPKTTQALLSVLTMVLSVIYFALITWQSLLAIIEEYSNEITSSVLLIDTYPFFIPLFVSFAVLTVWLATRFYNSLTLFKKG